MRSKVLFVQNDLHVGGAEKVLHHILQHIDRKKFLPTLAVFEMTGGYVGQVPGDITLFDLQKKSRLSLPLLVTRLAKLIDSERPNAIISFLEYSSLISCAARMLSASKPKIILGAQNHYSIECSTARFSALKTFLYRKLFPKVDKIVACSQGVEDDLVEFLGIPKAMACVIRNPVSLEDTAKLKAAIPDHPWYQNKTSPLIVAVGRLTKQKAHSDLLKAFAIVKEGIDSRLVIVGEGEDRPRLEQLCTDLNITKDVALVGAQENPYSFMYHSDVFVLSSHWEGFPLVLPEAMACGIPIVSTDCPSGPNEIITNNKNGILTPVGDVEFLAESILKILKNPSFARELVEAGLARANDFAVPATVTKYQAEFV
jgi:glycosyltransferase involved in cell wall biosynthesis